MNTIGRVKRVDDSKWDIQPKGFNNNIRWHAGHIFVTMEVFVQQHIVSYEPVYPDWIPLFLEGTSPKEWVGEVPSGEEILKALRAQFNWIIPILEDNLAKKAKEPLVIGNNIMSIDSVDGIIQFLSWHEGNHTGSIDALSKLE